MATASGLTTANSDATPVHVNGRARVRDITNDEYGASRPKVGEFDVLSIDYDDTFRATPYTDDRRKSVGYSEPVVTYWSIVFRAR